MSDSDKPLLFCTVHDAYLYTTRDEWTEPVCGDAGCHICEGRPEKPSQCAHPEIHE